MSPLPLARLLLLGAAIVALDPSPAGAAGRGGARRPKHGKVSASAHLKSRVRDLDPEPMTRSRAEPPSAPVAVASAATPAPPATHGPTRIDFDDRLIQGQSNAAGAVYLYDRKELQLDAMVKRRESFIKDVVGAVMNP